MADEKENLEAHQELDIRLREIEISHSSLASTIIGINGSINEMKQMFHKFLIDSERIAEIAGKIESISRLEREVSAIGTKYDDMYRKFIVLEHTCSSCTISKVDDSIKVVSDKVSKIENSLEEIKGSKNKFNGFWNHISQTVITIIILYLLYIVAMNIQTSGNIIANPPSVKASSVFVLDNAEARTFNNISAVLKRKKKYVK